MDLDLIGIDDGATALQLSWSDAPGWSLEKEDTPDYWVDVAICSAILPVHALPFAHV